MFRICSYLVPNSPKKLLFLRARAWVSVVLNHEKHCNLRVFRGVRRRSRVIFSVATVIAAGVAEPLREIISNERSRDGKTHLGAAGVDFLHNVGSM